MSGAIPPDAAAAGPEAEICEFCGLPIEVAATRRSD